MPKTSLKDALDYMPLGAFDFYTTIPILDTTTLPTDVDEAIITQGILAHNINEILRQFEGFPPLVMLARLGQHNEALQLMAAASVQYFRATRDFEITGPPLQFMQGSEQSISVHITQGAENVTEVIVSWGSNGDSVQMFLDKSENGVDWAVDWIFYNYGLETLTYEVNFGDKKLTESREITIIEDESA
ncbi:MAG: hypothetical protein RBT80_19205 [Candidatus Vecturithrix sp.]|jgi:hypothetical protein|nr:hypothetical protein [Candidatus Vecturithrix sp.]